MATFIAILRRKMLENCQIFRTVGGDPDGLGFNCKLPKEETLSGQPPPQSPTSVPTEQEKTGSLKASLAQSLNEFDKKLYEQQGKLRADIASQSQGASPADRSGKRDGGTDGSSAGTHQRVAEPGAGPGIDKPAVLRSSSTTAGDRDDDDVVARQLREAADKEADPIMKEKLWDEYRKYKASKR